MTLANMGKNFKNYMYEHFSTGLGNMLLLTGTLSWILSALGQLAGIAANDKISKEKKKFLYPQEIADAAINIFSFFIVTKATKDIGKYLVSSGRILTKKINSKCITESIDIIKDGKRVKGLDIGNALSTKAAEYEAALKLSKSEGYIIDSAKVTKFEEKIKDLKNFSDDVYAPFAGGMEVIGSVVGAVVSSNIITPLLRNPIASAKQKFDIVNEQIEKQQQAQLEKTNKQALNKQPLNTYQPRLTQPSGGMKI